MKNVKELFHSVMFNLSKVVRYPIWNSASTLNSIHVCLFFFLNQISSFNMFLSQQQPLLQHDLW